MKNRGLKVDNEYKEKACQTPDKLHTNGSSVKSSETNWETSETTKTEKV